MTLTSQIHACETLDLHIVVSILTAAKAGNLWRPASSPILSKCPLDCAVDKTRTTWDRATRVPLSLGREHCTKGERWKETNLLRDILYGSDQNWGMHPIYGHVNRDIMVHQYPSISIHTSSSKQTHECVGPETWMILCRSAGLKVILAGGKLRQSSKPFTFCGQDNRAHHGPVSWFQVTHFDQLVYQCVSIYNFVYIYVCVCACALVFLDHFCYGLGPTRFGRLLVNYNAWVLLDHKGLYGTTIVGHHQRLDQEDPLAYARKWPGGALHQIRVPGYPCPRASMSFPPHMCVPRCVHGVSLVHPILKICLIRLEFCFIHMKIRLLPLFGDNWGTRWD
jgi:hypothetical protein